MKANILIITKSEELSQTIAMYLSGMESAFVCLPWVYGRFGMSRENYCSADLFVLGLFRRDDLGYRAEGLGTAERLATQGRRAVLISGQAVADRLQCPFYWDLASRESLYERIRVLLRTPPPAVSDFMPLKEFYREYIRPSVDRHRFSKIPPTDEQRPKFPPS